MGVRIKRFIQVFYVLILTLLFTLGWNVSFAQRGEVRYFPETGHVVTDEFLEFYEKVLQAEFVFGYPITEAFHDQLTGRLVQYFQRARFELYPDAEAELRVQLTDLGKLIYQEGQKLPVNANTSTCRQFPEINNEFQVCYAFLEFFEAYGGVSTFGFPISDFEFQDGRIVQYFHRARFSWHPDLPAGQRVRLSDLGRLYFYQHGEDSTRLLPNVAGNISRSIIALKARAFPDRATIFSGEEQTVTVIVQDQNLLPIPQTQVSLTLHLPGDGKPISYLMDPTDEHGISRLTLPIESEEIGIVELDISATYSDNSDQTRTSFRIWWSD
jgi:hypothetical protein